jgi:hypothetical protein
LQLELHCIVQVDVPAQVRLQPLVQFATQSAVPPAQVQVPASESHEQLPPSEHARTEVTSLPSPSTVASAGGVLTSVVVEVSAGASALSWVVSAVVPSFGASVDASGTPPVPALPALPAVPALPALPPPPAAVPALPPAPLKPEPALPDEPANDPAAPLFPPLPPLPAAPELPPVPSTAASSPPHATK